MDILEKIFKKKFILREKDGITMSQSVSTEIHYNHSFPIIPKVTRQMTQEMRWPESQ